MQVLSLDQLLKVIYCKEDEKSSHANNKMKIHRLESTWKDFVGNILNNIMFSDVPDTPPNR